MLAIESHYLIADDPLGPFRFLTDDFLVGDEVGTLYTGKLLQDTAGNWQCIAFRNFTPEGELIGELTDPMPVTVAEDGRLTVSRIDQ